MPRAIEDDDLEDPYKPTLKSINKAKAPRKPEV